MEKYGPRCPICGTFLSGMGMPIPAKGKGYCGSGGIYFTYELAGKNGEKKYQKGKDGNLFEVKNYKVTKGDTKKHA